MVLNMYQNEKTQVENTMYNLKINQSMFYMRNPPRGMWRSWLQELS